MTRPVHLLRDGREFIALCEPCVGTLADVPRGRASIVARADDAHCIECDYHADCRPGCAARVDLAAYLRATAWYVALYHPEVIR